MEIVKQVVQVIKLEHQEELDITVKIHHLMVMLLSVVVLVVVDYLSIVQVVDLVVVQAVEIVEVQVE